MFLNATLDLITSCDITTCHFSSFVVECTTYSASCFVKNYDTYLI